MSAPRTVADVADALNLHPDTVRAAIRCGDLPGYQVGKKFVIPGDAFDDLIHGRWVPIRKTVVEVRTVDAPADERPVAADFIRKRAS